MSLDPPIDADSDKYLVRTASGSKYVLDFAAGIMRRTPSHGDDAEASGLETIAELLDVVDCRVGAPMVLRVRLPLPGVLSVKWTSSIVTAIEPLRGPEVDGV